MVGKPFQVNLFWMSFEVVLNLDLPWWFFPRAFRMALVWDKHIQKKHVQSRLTWFNQHFWWIPHLWFVANVAWLNPQDIISGNSLIVRDRCGAYRGARDVSGLCGVRWRIDWSWHAMTSCCRKNHIRTNIINTLCFAPISLSSRLAAEKVEGHAGQCRPSMTQFNLTRRMILQQWFMNFKPVTCHILCAWKRGQVPRPLLKHHLCWLHSIRPVACPSSCEAHPMPRF